MMRKGAAGSGVAMGFLRRPGVKPPAEFGAAPTIPPSAGRPRAFIWAALRAIFSARSRSYGVSP